MPCVPLLRSRDESVATTELTYKPEDANLWLPSNVGSKAACSKRLQQYEWKLRIAQADDTLDEIRQCVRLRAAMLTYKQAWVRGQGASTQAKNGLDRVEGRMDASIDRYMAARNALVSLAPLLGETGWESDRQQLNKHDARVMGELRQGATLGTDRLSWIWTTRPVALNDDPGVQEGERLRGLLNFDL
jgi:hypothetical protein